MKTDAKTMSLVLRRAAQNIDRGLKPFKDIQYLSHYGAWIDMVGFDIDESVEYRIKPKTIILSNGVEIPMPLNASDIKVSGGSYYVPQDSNLKYDMTCLGDIINSGRKIFYSSKSEAIEASKKLFGIE